MELHSTRLAKERRTYEVHTGYPKHLSGKDIPMFGMIIHVADVYDALIRKRA